MGVTPIRKVYNNVRMEFSGPLAEELKKEGGWNDETKVRVLDDGGLEVLFKEPNINTLLVWLEAIGGLSDRVKVMPPYSLDDWLAGTY